jgi:hypothetical protein
VKDDVIIRHLFLKNDIMEEVFVQNRIHQTSSGIKIFPTNSEVICI